MLHRWLPQNLYLRVLLVMIVCITLVLSGVTALTLRDTQSRLSEAMKDRGHNYAKIITHASSVYLAQKDTHQLILTATAATEGDQVQFVAFYSEDGELLATGASPNASATARASFGDLSQLKETEGAEIERWSNGFLEIAQPIVYQGQHSGSVALRLDANTLQDDLRRELTRSITTTIILAVVLSAALALLLRQFVIVPLKELSASSDQIAAGKWIIPSGRDRTDEFGKLARSFSQMVEALQARETQFQAQVAAVQTLNAELDERVLERTHELHELVAQQEVLLSQIRQMSMPVVPVLEGVIILPIIGSLDSQRAVQLVQNVLEGIEQHKAHLAVLDITGVPVVDTHVAKVILQAADAARLLGSTAVLVGIRPEVAQTLVQLGVNLAGIQTFATLQEVLRAGVASRRLR